MAVAHHGSRAMPSGGGRTMLGGGTDGNEQLTAIAGILLLVLLAVLGVTIVRIGQLLWLHLFLGMLLIGPVVLKMASTGYRFVRYYSVSEPYRLKGPPHPLLRGLAPFVVVSTLAVLATGVLLLVEGLGSRDPLLLWHKVSFFVWLGAIAPHVLGHLAQLPPALRLKRDTGSDRSFARGGGAGRAIAPASAIVGGAVVAIVLLPDFAAWTSAAGHFHHHHG